MLRLLTTDRAAGWLLVVAAVPAGLALVPDAALADLWVSSSGTDTGYCSQANPCSTISRAVSLAIPNDTIYIGPGSYSDRVVIPSTKPGDPNSGQPRTGESWFE